MSESSGSSSWCEPQFPPTQLPSGRSKLAPITPSSLCSYGWRPILIGGLIRDLLIRHFSTPLNIEEGDLRQLVWQEGVRTGILIESITRWKGDLVEKRPAVIIKENARQNQRMAIGDLAGTDGQGNHLYQTFWIGSHTLFCIHGSGASVGILATEVQRELTQFFPTIIEYLGLYNWQVTEVGAIQEVEEARESFVIPVTVGWCYSEKWKLSKESLKQRKIALSVLLGDALVQ